MLVLMRPSFLHIIILASGTAERVRQRVTTMRVEFVNDDQDDVAVDSDDWPWKLGRLVTNKQQYGSLKNAWSFQFSFDLSQRSCDSYLDQRGCNDVVFVRECDSFSNSPTFHDCSFG
jgi:hypothetical protein